MRIAVFGLGYVGVVSAACLAANDHDVVGVDVNRTKVDAVNDGRTTVLEERIGDLVADGVASGRLRATTSVADAVAATDLCFICVGTPSAANGSLSTTYLERVADEIGAALPDDRRYVVVVRSTMLPGTCDRVLVPRLESASGLTAGQDFAVCVHPEFLREGSSVTDFFAPPKTVVGGDHEADMATVSGLYAGFAGPTFHVPRPVAEMAKYVDNSFHALKVAFANEVGALCKVADIDSHQVMDVFKADTKLNISTAYLTPGCEFGGSCLPKDVRAVTHHARHLDVAVPVLDAVLRSNDVHFERAVALVEANGRKRVGLFGLAFKHGTDDLRESPMVLLAERLVGRGYEVLIHDANVSSSRLVGANREYVETHLPHLSRLLRSSIDDVLVHAEVCVVGAVDPDVLDAVKRAEGRPVIDLVRLPEVDGIERYEGICW
jgi:GDP-mannose 6-dehydrogenase